MNGVQKTRIYGSEIYVALGATKICLLFQQGLSFLELLLEILVAFTHGNTLIFYLSEDRVGCFELYMC